MPIYHDASNKTNRKKIENTKLITMYERVDLNINMTAPIINDERICDANYVLSSIPNMVPIP